MKQLTVGLIIGVLTGAGATYLISSNASPLESAGHTLTESRHTASKTSKVTVVTKSTPQAIANNFSSYRDGKSQLLLANKIFKLNREELVELLGSHELEGINYYDSTGMILLSSAISRLTEISPQDALEALDKMSANAKSLASATMFREWALIDIETALEASKNLKNKQSKKMAYASVLGVMAESNPNRAFELAKATDNHNAKFQVIMTWAKIDPKVAITKASEFGQGQDTWITQNILTTWAQKSPNEALEYVNSLEKSALKSQAILGIIQSKANTDVDAAYKFLELYKDDISSDEYRTLSYTLVSLDPERALEHATTITTKTKKSEAIIGVISQIASDDVNKAFELAETHKADILNNNLYSLAYNLGRKDPKRTLEWLNSMKGVEHKTHLYGTVLKEWFSKDKEQALTYYHSITNKSEKKEIGNGLLQSLYNEPKKLLELSKVINVSLDHNQNWAVKNALSKLAIDDLAAAKEYVSSIDNILEKKNALQGLIEGLTSENPETAIEFINELPAEEREISLGQVYDKMADTDPQKVADLFLAEGITKVGDYEMSGLMWDFAQKDLEGAKAFYSKIEDPVIRDNVISNLINSWASEDPFSALEFSFEQTPTEGLQNSMWQLGRKIANDNPEKGVELVLAQTPNSINKQLINSIYREWAENDVNGAIQGLASLPDNHASTKEIYSQIASNLSNTPEKAQQWLNTLPNGANKDSASYDIAYGWAQDNPNNAAEWVNTLADGNQRDSAVKGLVYTFDDAEPQYALEWASSMTNQKQRNSTLSRTFNAWKDRDRDVALEWLKSSEIVTPKQKENWAK